MCVKGEKQALISLTAVGLFSRRQLVNMPVWAQSVFVIERTGPTVDGVKIVQKKVNKAWSDLAVR